jgi:hypothetical protein
MGQLRGAVIAEADRLARFQSLGVTTVRPMLLGWQLIVIDSLANECVPEPVRTGLHHQHPRGHGRPQRLYQRTLVHSRRCGEKRMTGRIRTGCNDAQHLLGRLRKTLNASQEQVAQALGQTGQPAMVQQRLHEKRHPLTAPKNVGCEVDGRLLTQNRGDLSGHVPPRQPGKF